MRSCSCLLYTSWGKDYTELYDEIGDKVTIDDVQEDPTTGLAYVEYEGKTYELGMDFLSMAMVYKTAVPENSQYETEDDVYAAWWKYYMTRWNYLLPEIPQMCIRDSMRARGDNCEKKLFDSAP